MRELGHFKAATLAFVLLFQTGLAAAQDTKPPSIDEVMSRLGYSDQDRAALLSGDIVATDVNRTREDQLIAAAAVFLPVTVDTLLGRARNGDGLRADPGISAVGTLGSDLDAREWRSLRFEESERTEAERLLRFRGGSDFNLSEDEIKALRDKLNGVSANSAEMLENVSAAYREILAERHQAYLRSGLEGIADYRQGGTTLHPAQELGAVVDQAKDFLTTYFPEFWLAFSNFPEAQGPEVTNNFYWLKREVEGRPEFVLMHEMIAGGNDYALLTRREYFVGHTYESLQVIAVALPVDNGTAVFYLNSAFTDQITGFFSGVALSVGQGRMKDDLTAYFRTLLEVR